MCLREHLGAVGAVVLLLFCSPRLISQPTTCKKPSTELKNQDGKGIPGVTAECTLTVKDNKPTVKCKFRNSSGADKRFLYCFMIGAKSGKFKKGKMDRCFLCKDGNDIKCKPGNTTLGEWEPGWHFGCEEVTVANGGNSSVEFSSDEPFKDKDGLQNVKASDFVVSYADVVTTLAAGDRFNKQSCKEGGFARTTGGDESNEPCTKCPGIGRNRFINTDPLKPAIVDWVFWQQPFEDPFFKFQPLAPPDIFPIIYVRYDDIFCTPPGFPGVIPGVRPCPVPTGAPPPISVDLNLFDTFTMGSDALGSSVPAYLKVGVDSLPSGVTVKTNPPPDTVFRIPFGEELFGRLTVSAPPELLPGTRMNVTVGVFNADDNSLRFEQKGRFINDRRPPVVVSHAVSPAACGKISATVSAQDDVTGPLAANFWVSRDDGQTWRTTPMESTSDLLEPALSRTFSAATGPFLANTPLRYFFTVQDEVLNTVFFGIGNTASSSTVICDINGDGKVDVTDINAIFNARGTSARPGDPRDADCDGLITVNDGRICTLLCAKPNCAP